MNTPLSDEMQALLAYANETTEVADSTLGDAVKTLCDGYGQGGGEELPTFYDWVKPAESNSTYVYIDTGIPAPPEDSLVTIILAFDSLGKNSLKMFGTTASSGYSSSEGCIGTYTPATLQFQHASGGYLANLNESAIPHVGVITYKVQSSDSAVVSCDGNTASRPFSNSNPLGEGNFSLFGWYVSAWGRMGGDVSKCYGLQIFINSNLVFNGKPAQDENGAGMYDFVTKTMLYNAGSNGSLVVGND